MEDSPLHHVPLCRPYEGECLHYDWPHSGLLPWPTVPVQHCPVLTLLPGAEEWTLRNLITDMYFLNVHKICEYNYIIVWFYTRDTLHKLQEYAQPLL